MIRALSSEPLNDRWLITGLVGRGSSGTVYRGFDLVRERVVAIKTLGVRAPGARSALRARREFLDLASIRHPNLVETFDLGTASSGPLRRGSSFFTMELLEEAPMAASQGKLEPTQLARLALDLLAALACVHGHGLVHNDVKPSNVLLERRSDGEMRIKLADLGLASRTGRSWRGGAWRGTLHYASPETLAGGPREARSDLYSLGVLLYEAATGSLPFSESDPGAALEWHLRGLRPEIPPHTLPPALCRVIGRLLSVRPEARFARAREAWEEIVDALPDAHRTCPPGDRTCAGPLGGRRLEQRRLAAWLMAAVREGGCLTVTGSDGSGLSRLAREAEVLGKTHGLIVHGWRCAEGDRSFAPFCRPLREMILRAFKPKRGRRVPKASDLLALLGGPALWSAPQRILDEAPETLALCLARFLLAHVLEAPILLVLDDFERADEGTRLVVEELCRALARQAGRILIVKTTHDEAAMHDMTTMCDATATDGRWSAGYMGGAKASSSAGSQQRARPRVERKQCACHAGRAVLPVPCAGRVGIASWARAHGRRAQERALENCTRIERMHLGPLSLAEASAVIDTLTCIGRMHPEDRTALYGHSEGLPGRLVRLAHAMAGRQRMLFPPLREPCSHLE